MTLTLIGVVGADTGGYSCIVTNAYGSVTSSVANLTVVDPLILIRPTNQTVNLGNDAAFSITCIGTLPLSLNFGRQHLIARLTA